MSLQNVHGAVSIGLDRNDRGSGVILLRSWLKAAGSFLTRFGLLLAFLLLWHVASTLRWINPSVFPPLDVIASAFWRGMTAGTLATDLGVSLQRSGLAFGAAVAVSASRSACSWGRSGWWNGRSIRSFNCFARPRPSPSTRSSSCCWAWASYRRSSSSSGRPVPAAADHDRRGEGGGPQADRDGPCLRRLAACRLPPRRSAGLRCHRSSSVCGSRRRRRSCCSSPPR